MMFDKGLVLPETVIEAMKRCFRILGKVGILRIDGHLDGADCSIIE